MHPVGLPQIQRVPRPRSEDEVPFLRSSIQVMPQDRHGHENRLLVSQNMRRKLSGQERQNLCSHNVVEGLDAAKPSAYAGEKDLPITSLHPAAVLVSMASKTALTHAFFASKVLQLMLQSLHRPEEHAKLGHAPVESYKCRCCIDRPYDLMVARILWPTGTNPAANIMQEDATGTEMKLGPNVVGLTVSCAFCLLGRECKKEAISKQNPWLRDLKNVNIGLPCNC